MSYINENVEDRNQNVKAGNSLLILFSPSNFKAAYDLLLQDRANQ